MSSLGTPLSRTLSHPDPSSPLPPSDAGLTFPELTERPGAPSNVYQITSPTGLVDANELEVGSQTRRSSNTAIETPGVGGEKKVGDAEKGTVEKDAKIVTWLENDPENPREWSKTQKWVQTVLATLLCFNVGLASSIITGGLVPMADDFHVSAEVMNLTVCLFVVGFGVGPLFFAPLSEVYGRKPIYLISMGLFVIFTIPCAVTHSAAVIIVFRLISGLCASAPMTNAAGSIADCWSINERGHKMAGFSSILFASPCLGPIIGGYIAENTTWRWIYGVLLIFSAVVWLFSAVLLKETYAPTLLARRAAKLRKESGDPSIQTEQERMKRPFSEILSEALLRPLQMLCTEAIMILFSLYLCLIYGLLYGFFFSIPIVFAQGHGFTYGQTGLVFIGILVGIAIVALTAVPIQENYYQRKVIEGNGQAAPESRLPLMMGCSIMLPASLFIFAWTSMPYVSWVGPAVAGIPFGFSLIGIYISANSYLIDTYSRYGASAMAAKTFIRSLAGASVPMWIDYMYARLGNAWAGSIPAFIAVAMAPIPFVFYFKGAQVRKLSKMAS